MGVCCSRQEINIENKFLSKNTVIPNESIILNKEAISASMFVNKKPFYKLQNDYQIKEFLGKGGYGIVQKVIHILTGDTRAMKSISREALSDSIEEDKLFKEVEILKKLEHPNILKIYEFYYDSKNYYIITEYCKGGELFDKINEMGIFSEKLAASIIKQVLQAVAYCHSNGIVHRDLKPENILIESSSKNDFSIKIIDFGASSTFKAKQKLTEKTGTVR